MGLLGETTSIYMAPSTYENANSNPEFNGLVEFTQLFTAFKELLQLSRQINADSIYIDSRDIESWQNIQRIIQQEYSKKAIHTVTCTFGLDRSADWAGFLHNREMRLSDLNLGDDKLPKGLAARQLLSDASQRDCLNNGNSNRYYWHIGPQEIWQELMFSQDVDSDNSTYNELIPDLYAGIWFLQNYIRLGMDENANITPSLVVLGGSEEDIVRLLGSY